MFIKNGQVVDSSDSGMGILISTKYIGCAEEGDRIKVEYSTVGGHISKYGIIRNLYKFENPLTGEKLLRLELELFNVDKNILK